MILMSDGLADRISSVQLDEDIGDKIILEINAGENVLKCIAIGFTLTEQQVSITFKSSAHVPILLHKSRSSVSCTIYDGTNSIDLEMKNITIVWDDREGKHYCTICSNLDSERSVS